MPWREQRSPRSEDKPTMSGVVGTAVIMGGVAILLALTGVTLLIRGSGAVLVFGLLLLGWGAGGLISAVVLAIQSGRR